MHGELTYTVLVVVVVVVVVVVTMINMITTIVTAPNNKQQQQKQQQQKQQQQQQQQQQPHEPHTQQTQPQQFQSTFPHTHSHTLTCTINIPTNHTTMAWRSLFPMPPNWNKISLLVWAKLVYYCNCALVLLSLCCFSAAKTPN